MIFNQVEATGGGAEILVDDARSTWEYLQKSAGVAPSRQQVNVVLDNCGLELLSDLAFVDAILTSNMAAVVCLHCKADPVFVSDVMPVDIHNCLDWLRTTIGPTSEVGLALAKRLAAYIRCHRILIAPHTFYNSALAFWEMPAGLRLKLCEGALTIGE